MEPIRHRWKTQVKGRGEQSRRTWRFRDYWSENRWAKIFVWLKGELTLRCWIKKKKKENINKDAILFPHLCHTILIATWITWDPNWFCIMTILISNVSPFCHAWPFSAHMWPGQVGPLTSRDLSNPFLCFLSRRSASVTRSHLEHPQELEKYDWLLCF